jgi:penicillin-insensitive murein endopeptidase
MKNILSLIAILLFSQVHASESVGYYSKGSLINAQSVLDQVPTIQKLFIAREKLYSTDQIFSLLSDASEFISGNFPNSEILQVGDLSAKNGGPAVRHASHQNGLDADIVYLRRNKYVQSNEAAEWDEDFIGKNIPTENFNTERNFALFKFLVTNTPVTRIFVDAAIKKQLCQFANSSGEIKDPATVETLRRLRPEDLHRTHFHLRIGCPPSDHNCTPQSEPVTGSGCDDLSMTLELAQNLHSC